ncbi:hypothetical protein GCM10022198_02070 [Klugiella xanthotipulae]|uniref:Glycerophosphoryl diester phosphodiesterase family protein n=1 Tax=Klugiella xanthotipulae TaxID=244735 RepID=A0A543I4Y6_9MICO|nr:hypothetical protein [Klugiella xanthotipulae]TQM65658.1 hypothetical protein FB466_0467 [Klugiella xanthotipulae]
MDNNREWTAPDSSGQGPGYGQPSYGQPGYGQPGYPQVPGWSPAPQPGLIPLRPLGFGTLIGVPFQVFRRNPRPTLGAALLLQTGIALLSSTIMGLLLWYFVNRYMSAMSSDQEAILAGGIATGIAVVLLQAAIQLVTASLMQGIISAEVAQATIGRKRTFRQLWQLVAPRFGTLLLWSLLTSVATLLSVGVALSPTILLIVAAVDGNAGFGWGVVAVLLTIALLLGAGVVYAWVSTKLAIVPATIVLEKASLGVAITRSWRLTSGAFWRTFGVIVLFSVIITTAASIITVPLGLVYQLFSAFSMADPSGTQAMTALIIYYIASLVLNLILSAITTVATSACYSLIYIDRRIRAKGLDVDLVRYTEYHASDTDASPLDNPFLPRPTSFGPQ